MPEINNDIIYTIVQLVVLVIASLLGRYIIPFAKSKMNMAQLELMLTYALTYVRGAEEMISGDKVGETRLEAVTTWMQDTLTRLGIHASDAQIRALIEQAVSIMHEEQA